LERFVDAGARAEVEKVHWCPDEERLSGADPVEDAVLQIGSGSAMRSGLSHLCVRIVRQSLSRLAGAFQDFFKFEFVARQSVGVGDVPRVDDQAAVAAAVNRSGAGDVVDQFAAGLDTQLGPTWPGGVEISFGKWQKLALARGFMRERPLLLVLDEPTAALDAETEHALFERYAAAAAPRPADASLFYPGLALLRLGADSRFHRGAGWCARGGGWHARGATGQRRPVRGALQY
jgi:hypothetical protein